MKNFIGAMAAERFAGATLISVQEQSVEPTSTRSSTDKIQAISWDQRILIFDKTPPFIKKNIDVILLNTASGSSAALASPASFLACGELKGGIDPAGADEHWKTAKSALDRIRSAFKDTPPELFFVGAAIETAMAVEIFLQLHAGDLAHAANLTSPEQLADLVSWLVSL